MAFGVYVHIPYCLQRCSYCDFATYEWKEILPPEEYVELVKSEISARAASVPFRDLDTVYFGGGTPSLIEAKYILAILEHLEKLGFKRGPNAEVTLEINPATLDPEKIRTYISGGVNRFSVGAQSFNDDMLKRAGRKHSAKDTVDTLELLADFNVDYSFDLLFALPGQTKPMLQSDLEMVQKFSPNHLSAYCLTVPESHPMQKGRPPEDDQLEMFDMIEERLAAIDLNLYEISNFAKPGHASKHNMLYWTDESYWGVGLSAHSYIRSENGDWGRRFWNPPGIEAYRKQASLADLPSRQQEILERHQALTDFCHTSFRLSRGLDLAAVEKKFSSEIRTELDEIALPLEFEGLIEKNAGGWSLTKEGRRVSNYVFERFTFLD